MADAAVERERLTAQVEELRDRVHHRDFLWQRIIEQTTTLHATAQQGIEG
jgi:hypothetical protein